MRDSLWEGVVFTWVQWSGGVGKRVSLSRCYLRARVIDCSLEIVGAMPPLIVLFHILLKNPPPPHRIALEILPLVIRS